MGEVPVPHYLEPGHRFDAGPYLSDLYRLLCMEIGDRLVVRAAIKSPIFERLREQYIEGETIRILTSSSIALRILFDRHDAKRVGRRRHDENLDEVKSSKCGLLYARWPVKRSEVLTLREACNKIIHATTIHRDIADPDPGRKPSHYRPYLYLYGKKDSVDWRARLSIIAFAEHATTALIDPTYLGV
jgi:hypothetical protein